MPGYPFVLGNQRAAKLTGEQVIAIRERYRTERGLSQPMLAREYNVSKNTIASIVNGTSWRHLLDQSERGGGSMPPRQITDEEIKASQERLAAMMHEAGLEARLEAETNEPSPGLDRLNSEARKILIGVGDELEQLEKGD